MVSKNGENVLKGIVAILGLGIGYRIFRLVTRVGKAIGRLVQISGALVKGGGRVLQQLLRLFTRGTVGALGGGRGFKLLLKGSTGARNLLGGAKNLIKSLPSKQLPFLGTSIKELPILNRFRADAGSDALLDVIGGRNFGDAIRDAGIKSIQKPSTIKAEKIASQKILEEFLTKNPSAKSPITGATTVTNMGEGLESLVKSNPKLADSIRKSFEKTTLDPLADISRVGTGGKGGGIVSGMTLDAAEGAARSVTAEVLDPTDKLPNFGKKIIGASSKKLATNTALKGTLKNVARGLPLLGTYLDSVSAIEELKKGNFYAAGLFGAGAVTSIIPGMQGASLGFSLSAIAASVVEDKINTPNLSMNKKKDIKVTVVPIKSEDKISNSGSGDTNTKVYSVSSIDRSNPNSFVNQNLFNMVGV
jgi:hypothetical protein